MRRSISEMAKLSGVSVRTLHYYDEIGLLKPSEVNEESGYRYYDEQAAERLQQILFYRELDFPLKEIVKIMNSANYKKEDALVKQRELLLLKRNRLDKLVKLLDQSLKGDYRVSFKEFDMNEINEAKEKYAEEVKKRWGTTEAYKENEKKTAKYKDADWKKMMELMDGILKKFSEQIGKTPDDPEVQKLVGEWQQFITDYYYECTNEILAGLGQMYIADERFTKNMDKFKEGTAKLVSDAIKVYCNN